MSDQIICKNLVLVIAVNVFVKMLVLYLSSGNWYWGMKMGEMKTPLSKIKTTPSCTPGGTKVREEKILVMVRVRPLSSREQAMYDLIALDCPDDQSVVFKNPNDERPSSSFTFGNLLDCCLYKRDYSIRFY